MGSADYSRGRGFTWTEGIWSVMVRPIFCICLYLDFSLLKNMALDWFWITDWIKLHDSNFNRTSYLTYFGLPVIRCKVVVWTTSICRHWLELTKGTQATPVFVSKDIMYSFNIFIFDLVGIRLFLFSIGYSIPLTLIAFLISMSTCAPKFSLRPIVTSSYLAVLDHPIGTWFMVIWWFLFLCCYGLWVIGVICS